MVLSSVSIRVALYGPVSLIVLICKSGASGQVTRGQMNRTLVSCRCIVAPGASLSGSFETQIKRFGFLPHTTLNCEYDSIPHEAAC